MIIKPFGPEIYKTVLPEGMASSLEEVILKNQDVEHKNLNKYLAGLIKKEVDILPDIKETILPTLHQFVLDYLNQSNSFDDKLKPFRHRDLTCVASWGNIQEEHEFNPLHNHATSDIVCVTFPKVDIKNKSLYKTNSTVKPGSLILTYGEGNFNNTSYTIFPSTGDVYIFPASLAHYTYPIYGDDVRISTSTNFSFTEYFRMKFK